MTEALQAMVEAVGNHPNLALLITFLVSAGEAIFVIGLFVPSTVVLVGVGTLIGMGKLPFIPMFVATMFGAIAGDAISYWIGHIWKEEVRELWPFKRYTSLLDKGEAFFARHGGKSIFIGRFIPGVKAVVPGVAGIVGMDPRRFTLINIVSAVAWTAAHLLPAIGVGRSIDVAQTSNPRLLWLLLIIAVTAVLIGYAVKLAFGLLLPIAERWRLTMAGRLARLDSHAGAWAARLIANEGGVLVPYTYAAIALFALSGFVMLVVNLLFDPELARSDAAISGYLQALRTDIVDKAMIAITMLGDSVVLVALALSLIVTFLVLRRWRLASSVAVAFGTASLFVPVMKTLLHRARPTALYDGAEAFSFPSGHATLSTTVFGITVLLLVHALSDPIRRIAYLATAVVIALIALSRVYLLAHWPSDVLAGILFGGSLVFTMAFLMHGRELRLPIGALAGAVVATVLTVYPLHLHYGYATAKTQYARATTPIVLDRQQWIDTEWRRLPRFRHLLDGDAGEPILVQTDMPLPDILEDLQASGWQQLINSRLDELIGSVLPATGQLPAHPPRPLTNNGRSPLTTFVRPSDYSSKNRIVLRVWRSKFILQKQSRTSTILLMSATVETLDPILLGLSLVEPVDANEVDINRTISGVVEALQGRSSRAVFDQDPPVIVPNAD